MTLKAIATIVHNEDSADDPNARRVELALGTDGDIWAREPGGEWFPTATSRRETADTVADTIAIVWRAPVWALEFLDS